MNVTTQQWLKRLPSWMFKAGAQAWIDYQYPRHLFIETTAACNLTCTFCPRENRNNHMDFSVFQAIVQEASRYGSRSFSLHLFGETFLYPRWQDAVAFIKAQNPRHTVLATTNGTTLNRRVDDVIHSGINQVFWTWRTEAQFTTEMKEKLRRWGRFRVRFIKEVTPPEAYKEWADWPNVEGRELHNYGGNIDISAYPKMENSHSNLEKATISLGNGSLPNWKTDVNVKVSPRWPCYHLWLAPAVAWNGNLLLCCADPHHKEVLGTFPQMTVAQAWKSERLQAIRTGHLKGEYRGICANCDVWKQYPDLFFKWQQASLF